MKTPFVKRGLTLVPLIVILAGAGPLQQAEPRADDDRVSGEVLLRVDGEVDHPLSLSLRDLEALPKQVARGVDHGGETAEFDGTNLIDVLKKAGAPVGDRLRGKMSAAYVVVEAADGYRVVFSLAELDPSFTDKVVMLAHRRDGKPLGESEGPLRVIVPNEKRHGRWIRMVKSMTVRLASPDEPPTP